MQAKFRVTLTQEELIEMEKHLTATVSNNPMLLKVLASLRVQLVKIDGGLVKPAFVSNTSSTKGLEVSRTKSSTLGWQVNVEELRYTAYIKLQEQGRENLNSAELELADTYMYFNNLLSEEEKGVYEERYLGV